MIHTCCIYYRNIFSFIGFIAITTSSFTKISQVTQTSWIFSIGRNDAGPYGLNKSWHQSSMGFEKVLQASCSWNHFTHAILTSTYILHQLILFNLTKKVLYSTNTWLKWTDIIDDLSILSNPVGWSTNWLFRRYV